MTFDPRTAVTLDLLRKPIFDGGRLWTVEKYEQSVTGTLNRLGMAMGSEDFSKIFGRHLGQMDTASAFLLARFQRAQSDKIDSSVINRHSPWLQEMEFSNYISNKPLSDIKTYSNPLPTRIRLSKWDLTTEDEIRTDDETRWKQFEPLFKRMVESDQTDSSQDSTKLIKMQLREILANISEHSSSKFCHVAAQFYANTGKTRYIGDNMIEISIFNEEPISSQFAKRFVKKELDNEVFYHAKGLEQLFFALMPGFTTKSPTGVNVPQGDTFAIGSGLFLLSSLANKFGVFLLASGEFAVVVARGWSRPAIIAIPEFRGTLVSFRINTVVGDLETFYPNAQKVAVQILRKRIQKFKLNQECEPKKVESACDFLQDRTWKSLFHEFYKK